MQRKLILQIKHNSCKRSSSARLHSSFKNRAIHFSGQLEQGFVCCSRFMPVQVVGVCQSHVHSFCFSSLIFCGSRPRNVFMASGAQGEAKKGHAAAGRVLRPPEESLGENFPEAEIYQQTRQEETCQ